MGGNGDTLLEFPCRFAVKAMGENRPDFVELVVAIVARHVAGVGPEHASTRASRGDRWLAVTVTFEATSKAQLDAIYRELSGHPRVTLAL